MKFTDLYHLRGLFFNKSPLWLEKCVRTLLFNYTTIIRLPQAQNQSLHRWLYHTLQVRRSALGYLEKVILWFATNTSPAYHRRGPCPMGKMNSGVIEVFIRRDTDLIPETWKQYERWRIPSTTAIYANFFTVEDGWATTFRTSTEKFNYWTTSTPQPKI